MPLTVEFPKRKTGSGSLSPVAVEKVTSRGRRLDLGLVNNMPDAAFGATERQFCNLLKLASDEFDLHVRLFALCGVPRNAATQDLIQEKYYPTAALSEETLDAIIVTGAEPRAATLPEEVYWDQLIVLFDWARAHTHSVLFSCLAAHAAVLYWDGISRVPLQRKLSGVFRSSIICHHPLVANISASFAVPHSRVNGVDEAALLRKGYLVLARSRRAGIDIFIRDSKNLLVFIHGHPEYDADSLAREYRRDLTRFLVGERSSQPQPPENYFSSTLVSELEAFAAQTRGLDPDTPIQNFPHAALAGLSDEKWRADSVQLFRNWVQIISERKNFSGPDSQ